MKYLSYRRVSKNEKDTGSVSLEWQRAEIDRWLSRHKVSLHQDYMDDGVSAQKSLGRRPSGKRLVADAMDGPCTVVCAHMDRIFRSSREFQNQTHEWACKGILFVTVNGGMDLTTPEGRCFATCMAAFHQLEREKTSERNLGRGKQRKESGMRYCAWTPYGFMFKDEVTGEDGKKTGGILVRNEDEQRWIAKMREWQKSGWTLRRIADALNETGVPSRRGKPWKHSTVQKILDTVKARLAKKNREDGGGPAAPDLTIHVKPEEKNIGPNQPP